MTPTCRTRARAGPSSTCGQPRVQLAGLQSLQKFQGRTRPAQTRKVAANQAFFEYQPARMARPDDSSLERFAPPQVVDAPITRFDDNASARNQQPGRARKPQGYRALRWGRHIELIITDQRSYRSEEPSAWKRRGAVEQ